MNILMSGAIIFFGMVFLGFKLPIKTSLTWLGHALLLDIAVTVLTFVMHYGTFSGVMAAALAGLMTSVFTSACRWAFGFIRKGQYTPGKIWSGYRAP